MPTEETDFVEALKKSGLLSELPIAALPGLLLQAPRRGVLARRQTILSNYYEADGDGEVSRRRQLADRYFAIDTDDPATASEIIARLDAINPELGGISLQSVESPQGMQHALRAPAAHSIIRDEWARLSRPTTASAGLPLRSIVRALNELLRAAEVSQRLVPLLSDRSSDVYLGITRAGAAVLSDAGYLEDIDLDDVTELCRF